VSGVSSGDWALVGFSPRKQNLADVDHVVLEKLIGGSVKVMRKRYKVK